MINHYFFLAAVADELHQSLMGSTVESILSPAMGELRLRFRQDKDVKELRLNWETNQFLFRLETEDTRLPKQYEKQLFDAWGQRVTGIYQAAFDRYWVILLENDNKIIIKCFPLHGNAILLKGEEVLSVFRRSRQKDFDFQISQLHLHQPDAAACLEAMGNHPAFAKLLQTHPLSFWENWLKHRSFLWDDTSWKVLPALDESRAAALEISERAFRAILPAFLFRQKKDAALRQIEQQERQLLSKIEIAETSLLQLLDAVDYQTQGQLLLSNMHLLHTGAKEANLERWDQPDAIVRVKLDPALTVVENANRLFQKAKNQHIAREKQEEYLSHLLEQKEHLEAQKHTISGLERLRDFKKVDFTIAKGQKTGQPWRVFRLHGFEIWIGKSATGNDELLRRGHKDDIWLHARDVSGSHVLIRNAGRKIPQPLLESAASWAAFYSKGKNEQWCPVSYTERKYVRKPKGAAPGAAVVDRENVLIVPPMAPSSSE